MAKKHKFARGVFWGGLVGSITALFMAPKKGKELRSDAKKTAHQIALRLEKVSKEVHAAAKVYEAKIKKQGKGLPNEAKKALLEARRIVHGLEAKSKHFKAKGNKLKRNVVKETRDLVADSAEVLAKLKATKAAKKLDDIVNKSKKVPKRVQRAVKSTVKKATPKKKPAKKKPARKKTRSKKR